MLLMILSPSLITILLKCDGLEFSSYYSVIYYLNIKSYSDGILIALVNQLGDVPV